MATLITVLKIFQMERSILKRINMLGNFLLVKTSLNTKMYSQLRENKISPNLVISNNISQTKDITTDSSRITSQLGSLSIN